MKKGGEGRSPHRPIQHQTRRKATCYLGVDGILLVKGKKGRIWKRIKERADWRKERKVGIGV